MRAALAGLCLVSVVGAHPVCTAAMGYPPTAAGPPTTHAPTPHLVWQEAVGDVPAAQLHCRRQCIRGVDHVVVPLVPLLGEGGRRAGRVQSRARHGGRQVQGATASMPLCNGQLAACRGALPSCQPVPTSHVPPRPAPTCSPSRMASVSSSVGSSTTTGWKRLQNTRQVEEGGMGGGRPEAEAGVNTGRCRQRQRMQNTPQPTKSSLSGCSHDATQAEQAKCAAAAAGAAGRTAPAPRRAQCACGAHPVWWRR